MHYWVYSWQKQIFILTRHQWEWDSSFIIFHIWWLEDFPQTSFWHHTFQALFLSTTYILLGPGSHGTLWQIIFSKMAAIRSPILYSVLVLEQWHISHWGMGSVFLLLESQWVCDYSRSDTIWLPRVDHRKWYSICLGLWGHLPFEPSHHTVRKPRP